MSKKTLELQKKALQVHKVNALKNANKLTKNASKQIFNTRLPFVAKTSPKVKAGVGFSMFTSLVALLGVAAVISTQLKASGKSKEEIVDEVKDTAKTVAKKVKKEAVKASDNSKETIDKETKA